MAETVRKLGSPRPAAAPAGAASGGILRHVPALTLALFLAPIAAGIVGTWLPAFGYLPALGGETFGLPPWRTLLAHPSVPGAVRLTLTSGILATVLSFALAIGCVAACHGTRALTRIQRMLAPMLAMPHAAAAIGLAFLVAPSGWFARMISPWATGWTTPPDVALINDPYGLSLTLALVVKETPYLLLMILAALGQSRADERMAVARSLGYGPVVGWLKTVLPAIYPQIRLPVYAVLAFSLSVVDMALILAPSTPPPLAVLVYRWFNNPDLSLRFPAAAGAGLQLLLVAGAIAAWRGGEGLAARLGRAWIAGGGRGGSGQGARAAASAAMMALYAMAGLTLAALAIWSVAGRWRYPDAMPGAWTLDNWARHMDGIVWAGGTTLSVAVAASVAALVLVLGCLENEQRQGLRTSTRALWLLYTPLLVPQVAFLFGAQTLAVRLGLDGTWVGLVWSHLLFVLPYVFLTLADPFRSLDERYIRTARCLGAGPARVFWRVKLPMLIRPILFAAAVGFAVSVAQYLPTQFVGGGRFVTLTTEAVTLSAGADRRVIGVFAFLQAVLPLAAFAGALAVPARARRARRSPEPTP